MLLPSLPSSSTFLSSFFSAIQAQCGEHCYSRLFPPAVVDPLLYLVSHVFPFSFLSLTSPTPTGDFSAGRIQRSESTHRVTPWSLRPSRTPFLFRFFFFFPPPPQPDKQLGFRDFNATRPDGFRERPCLSPHFSVHVFFYYPDFSRLHVTFHIRFFST